MLVLSRKRHEAVRIGDDIKVMIVEVRGNKVRLGVEAPRSMPVHREEVWIEIQKEQNDGREIQ